MYFSPSVSHTLANFRKRWWSKIFWMPKWWQSLKTEWKNYGNKGKLSSKNQGPSVEIWIQTLQSSPTCPRRCRFSCWPRSHRGRTCSFHGLYTANGRMTEEKEANPVSFNHLYRVECARSNSCWRKKHTDYRKTVHVEGNFNTSCCASDMCTDLRQTSQACTTSFSQSDLNWPPTVSKMKASSISMHGRQQVPGCAGMLHCSVVQ